MRHTFTLLTLLTVGAPAFAQKPVRKPPADGTEFKLAPDAPKYVTADIEFRDPTGAKWPNFFYGKPAAAGTFTFHSKTPSAAFTLTCDKMAQKLGDQSRRVLGDITPEDKPPAVAFALTKCGEVKPIANPEKNGPKEQFASEGTLTVGGKPAKVAGSGTWKFNYGKDGEFPESIQLSLRFDAKGTDLGLKSPDPVQVTVSCVAFKDLPAAKK